MVTVQFISTVVTAGLLIVVLAAATRIGTRISRDAAAETDAGGSAWSELFDRLQALSADPGVWAVGFVLMAVGLGLGVVAVVGDGLVEGVPVDLLTVVVAATLALVIVSYLFWGTYAASRHRGLGNAQAVGVGIGTLSLLFLLLIVVQLVVGLIG